MTIGERIKMLRKQNRMTQENLAEYLCVSYQAVSKWECGTSYPDMEMIPVIAGYFEVSMDILFDYNLREMKTKIQKTIHDAHAYFFDDTEKYAGIMKDALQEYPEYADNIVGINGKIIT